MRATDRATDRDIECRARLVIGADGRYSTVRKAAGIDPGLLDSALELLWFKLPDTVAKTAAQACIDNGSVLLYFGLGGGEVQLGWFLKKGGYPELRKRSIVSFRDRLMRVDPGLASVFPDALPDFESCSLLHIEPGVSEH